MWGFCHVFTAFVTLPPQWEAASWHCPQSLTGTGLMRRHAGLGLDSLICLTPCCLLWFAVESVAATCCVPSHPQGLCSVVISRGSLRQDLNCQAEQLKCTLQIPSLCCRDALQLQRFHLLQQPRVKATVWQGEINTVKGIQTPLTGVAAKKTQRCHTQIKLD